MSKIQEDFEKFFQLDISIKKFEEKKFFNMKFLLQEDFHIETQEISAHQIIFLRITNETLATYRFDISHFDKNDIELIKRLSLICRQIYRQKNINLLFTEILHPSGKFKDLILFEQPILAGNIIHSLKEKKAA